MNPALLELMAAIVNRHVNVKMAELVIPFMANATVLVVGP